MLFRWGYFRLGLQLLERESTDTLQQRLSSSVTAHCTSSVARSGLWINCEYDMLRIRLQDKIYDKFLKNGRHYPMGHVFMPPRRYNDLVISLAWIILLSVPLFYYLGAIFISGSFYVQLGFIALFVLGKWENAKHRRLLYSSSA